MLTITYCVCWKSDDNWTIEKHLNSLGGRYSVISTWDGIASKEQALRLANEMQTSIRSRSKHES